MTTQTEERRMMIERSNYREALFFTRNTLSVRYRANRPVTLPFSTCTSASVRTGLRSTPCCGGTGHSSRAVTTVGLTNSVLARRGIPFDIGAGFRGFGVEALAGGLWAGIRALRHV